MAGDKGRAMVSIGADRPSGRVWMQDLGKRRGRCVRIALVALASGALPWCNFRKSGDILVLALRALVDNSKPIIELGLDLLLVHLLLAIADMSGIPESTSISIGFAMPLRRLRAGRLLGITKRRQAAGASGAEWADRPAAAAERSRKRRPPVGLGAALRHLTGFSRRSQCGDDSRIRS